ncbi:hypothetical protein [Streptomyces sp. NPDC052042]|uniref:hypothetical protein n=1 Tax=Streptomyces sp. NPDC052042 TaxID=3365683 RepID=UPI0037D317F6
MDEEQGPATLNAMLSEGFSEPGSPVFRIAQAVVKPEGDGIRLVATVDVTSSSMRDEQWIITLDFPAEDSAAAAPDASPSEHSWFTLMVRSNILEWWHTRKTDPNISIAPLRTK